MIINLNPEFGCELALGIPYAYWLHKQGKLDKVITCKGMKPFYYFCEDVEERYNHRTVDNGSAGLNDLPNNWVHHNALSVFGKDYSKMNEEEQRQANGVLDYSQWSPPPYKEYYKNDEFVFGKPIIVVSNKISMDHQKEPHSFFDLNTLYEIFNYLTENGYSVIYKRPKMDEKEFTIDQNEHMTLSAGYTISANVDGLGVIDDYQLTNYYDDVYLIDDLFEKSKYSANETQLKIFANAEGFVSIAGGNGIFCSYFGKINVTYVTTSGELREDYFKKDGYYQKLSDCDVIPIRDSETDIKKRGYNNYEAVLNKMKEVF
jgi:hypothetical protein